MAVTIGPGGLQSIPDAGAKFRSDIRRIRRSSSGSGSVSARQAEARAAEAAAAKRVALEKIRLEALAKDRERKRLANIRQLKITRAKLLKKEKELATLKLGQISIVELNRRRAEITFLKRILPASMGGSKPKTASEAFRKRITSIKPLPRAIGDIVSAPRPRTPGEKFAKAKLRLSRSKVGKFVGKLLESEKKLRTAQAEGRLGGKAAFDPKSFAISTATVLRKLGVQVTEAQQNKLELGFLFAIPELKTPPKDTIVKFVGKQRQQGNKVITEVFFKTNKKTVGIARGVTIQKGKRGVTITLGKSAKKGVWEVLPSGKVVRAGRRSFAGVDIAAVRANKLTLTKDIKGVGKIKRNINNLLQLSRGRIISRRGDRLFTKGLKTKGLKIDDLASVSRIFTRKDVSLIIGKTLTRSKDRIKFIGIIKGSKDTGKFLGSLSPQKQVLYKQALASVISTASSSVKAQKVIGLSTIAKTAVAAIAITNKGEATIKIPRQTSTTQKTKSQITKQVQQRPRPRTRVSGKTISRSKTTAVIKQRLSSAQAIKQKQKLRQLQKTEQKVKQAIKQVQSQKAKQKLRLMLKQIQVIKQKQKARGFLSLKVPVIPKSLLIPFISRTKKRKKKDTRKRKKGGYNVFARPTKKRKGKKRKKLVKVNKASLSKRNAKNLRNYIVDTSLSRTGGISRSQKKVRKPILKVPSNYAKRSSKKFRKYRIVKGKRKRLPSGKVIEKRKNLLDTRQEKRKISLRRRIKQITPKKKRKATPMQLKNLKKARRALKKKRS